MSLLSFSKKIKDKDKAPKAKKAAKSKDVKEKNKVMDVDEAQQVASDFAGRVVDLQPLVTEKSVRLQENNVVTFRVPKWAHSGQIEKAITDKYGVKVLSINTMTMLPKRRRRGATVGQTNVWKKAYVKVDDIQSLNTGP